jgi:hypothetical protein
MAVVQGVKEKVHLPIYDSLTVEPETQLRDSESTSILKFFVNVQGKTKLETNLQSASLLPHYNTFEARAMRVVISDLPPEFPDDLKAEDKDYPVSDFDDNGFYFLPAEGASQAAIAIVDENNKIIDSNDDTRIGTDAPAEAEPIYASFKIGLDELMELLREARADVDGYAPLVADEDSFTFYHGDPSLPDSSVSAQDVVDLSGVIWLHFSDIEAIIETIKPELKQPPKAQIHPNNGAGTLIGKFIYNTVTTLYVGEKIMIQMPTWFFPAGAGPYSETAAFTTHGEPSPTATFRFAEPVFIDRQQNFRVEIEVPDADVLKELQRIYGPLYIWVVLDGYMTRDVQ